MTEMLNLVASLVTLFMTVWLLLPRAARWIADHVRPHYYPGSMLMDRVAKLRHPFNREKRADFEFYLGWAYLDEGA